MFGSLVDAGYDFLWRTVSFIHVGDIQVTPILARARTQGLHGPWLIDAMPSHRYADSAWTQDGAGQWIPAYDDRWLMHPSGLSSCLGKPVVM